MHIRRVAAFLAPAVTFVVGGALAYWYLSSAFATQQLATVDALFLEQTNTLRALRQGEQQRAEHGLDQVAWFHVQRLSEGAKLGHPVPALVRPAVEYHCASLKTSTAPTDGTRLSERTAWCSDLRNR